jgi:hypothetical protein
MRIHLTSLFLAVYFLPQLTCAQLTGAGFSGLAGAGSALAGSVWACSVNPAGLAAVAGPSASCTASPARFGLQELSSSAVTAAWPSAYGVIAGGFDRFGYELFRQESLVLAFATSADRVRIGCAVRYYYFTISGYGSAGVAGIDCGIQIHAGHSVDLAAAIKNINLPHIGERGDPLPQSFTIGAAYQPGGIALIALDYNKETGFDAAPKCGVEYRIDDLLALRCGVSGLPSLVCGGFGVRFSLWAFDYAYASHPELGGTHEFTVSLLLGR